MKFDVLVLGSTGFDLTKFDFSFKDIKIYDIQSAEFEEYVNAFDDEPGHNIGNFTFFSDIIDTVHTVLDKKYAVVKNNYKKDFNFRDLENVWKILLIIFPSDLQMTNIVHFHDVDGTLNSYMTSFEKRQTGEYPGKPLMSSDDDVAEINEFIKLTFDKLNDTKYIGLSIENYLTSFHASHIHYQYLTLCMALESTVYGSEEVSYKLRRNIAVLCGEDPFNCEIIYNNLQKLYKLRSKIIHGEQFQQTDVEEYLPFIVAIVSRVIIELLVHSIPTNKELNQILTSLGYGDRKKISNKWKHFHLNVDTVVETNWLTL